MLHCSTTLSLSSSLSSGLLSSHPRAERYVAFDPPRIFPPADHQTIKAGDSYVFRCEGNGRGVSWRLPVDATDSLRQRIALKHYVRRRSNDGGARGGSDGSDLVYVSELALRSLAYTDTGTFVCTFNGTTDTDSIDNSTRVHLYVEDEEHLLKQSGVEILQLVHGDTAVLPCQPTHPDVNVTLVKVGSSKPVQMVSYDPRVST